MACLSVPVSLDQIMLYLAAFLCPSSLAKKVFFRTIFGICPSVPLFLMQNDYELFITIRLRPINVGSPSGPLSLVQMKLYLTDLELCPSAPLCLAKKDYFSHNFLAFSLCLSVFHAK